MKQDEAENEEIKNKIRNILIECRTSRNLTQTELGEIVGKSKTAIASWEQGLSMPDVVTMIKLARFYNKPFDYMFGEKEDDV